VLTDEVLLSVFAAPASAAAPVLDELNEPVPVRLVVQPTNT